MNPHTGRDFVQFGKTESVLNKGAEKIAPLFNPPPVLSLEIILRYFQSHDYIRQYSALCSITVTPDDERAWFRKHWENKL